MLMPFGGSDQVGEAVIPIDMHSHFYGAGLPEAMRRRRGIPKLVRNADGSETLWAMTAKFPFGDRYTELAPRRGFLKDSGLEAQLLTFPGALGLDVQPVTEVAGTLSAYNENLAGICADHPGQFFGLGGLPLADMAAAAEELRRLRRDLGLLGAVLPGNMLLSLEKLEALRPLFRVGEALGAHFMVHPGLAPGESPPPPFDDHQAYRASTVQLQSAISQTVLTLILSDVLERYPNVSFQVVNLGGTIPMLVERMIQTAAHRTPDRPFPEDRLRSLYYDTASMGPRAVEFAVRVLGADRIMLGTDFPIFRSDPTAILEDADMTADERRQVAGGTARTVIDRIA